MYRRAFHAATPLELAAQLEAFAAAGEQVKPAGEGRKMQVGGCMDPRPTPSRFDCVSCAANPSVHSRSFYTCVSTNPHSV